MKENKTKKWTKEAILEDAKKYKTRSEWKNKSPGAYRAAIKKRIDKIACDHMEILITEWTEEKILEDAKKYQTRSEWEKNNKKAYYYAIRRGILETACAHMERRYKTWTEEAILEDAKKYQTRSEWKNNSSGYRAGKRRGLLDKACNHMKKPSGTSKSEKSIFALVKQYYPKAQTLKDRKVFIPEKPHIKGFDIDIYIPELRKGVEFNGEYWHSIEGLKRSRKGWPKEDLENYHVLKIEHFNKKGIQILTIDEKEWLKNPNTCLEKIKAFLRVR